MVSFYRVIISYINLHFNFFFYLILNLYLQLNLYFAKPISQFFTYFVDVMQVRKKAKFENRFNQAPQLTQDTTWETQNHNKTSHTREQRGHSPFPAGDHKATRNRQENMTNMKHK